MPRVKRGVTARARHKKIIRAGQAIAVVAITSIALPSRP